MNLLTKVLDSYNKSMNDSFVDQQFMNRSHPVVQMFDYMKLKINPYAIFIN